jgi:hypothetical protein
MFNYTACTRPLGRVLAHSLTMAVALLIELGMLEQGLAAECDCKTHPIFHQACKSSHPGELFQAPANFGGPGSPKRDHASGTLKDVVEWDEDVRKGKSLTSTIIKWRAKYVWNLPSNDKLRKNEWGRNEKCICLNDEVCFPITFPNPSQHVDAFTHGTSGPSADRRTSRHVRSRVYPLLPRRGPGYRETPMFAPDAPPARNYNNPGLPDFQNGSRG